MVACIRVAVTGVEERGQLREMLKEIDLLEFGGWLDVGAGGRR